LLQADLSDLPFRRSCFDTILCMNVLHHFQEVSKLMPKLKGLLVDEGKMFLTSLVSNNRFIGDRYLKALHFTREFVRPRGNPELRQLLNESLNQEVGYRVKGNMAFVSAGNQSKSPDFR